MIHNLTYSKKPIIISVTNINLTLLGKGSEDLLTMFSIAFVAIV